MQKRLLYLSSCLFFSNSFFAIAQQPAIADTDSAWFEDYFGRVRLPAEGKDNSRYDSLEIIKSIAEKKNYVPAVCRYYIEKASFFLSKEKTDSAIRCFETAIRLAEKEKLRKEAGDAYLGLANLHQFNGNTLDAAQNYLQAVDLLKDLRRKRSLISLYHNLSAVLNKLKQKNGALENMLSAVAINNSNETNLVKIINTKSSEEEGLNFKDQTLVREGGRDGIYVIFGGAKFHVMDFPTIASYGASRDVQRIPTGTASLIPDFPRNGSILKELSDGDPKVYLVKDSLLYHINSPEVLENYGGWDAVYFTPKGSLKNFPKASQQVTLENVNNIFNLQQEFDILKDSMASSLKKNSWLSNELSQVLADRNNSLQKRKILLWASAIGLAALMIIVFLLLRNFRQKQKLNQQSMLALKKEEELQRKTAIEKERTRIATDMHDDLGAGLSRIKFLSETIGIKKQQQQPVEEDISKIREYSHEMIDKMGEIVWALNEKNDSLSDLLSYTRAYAVEYLSQNGIRCTVNAPDNFSLRFVSGEFRRNVYLTVKEALHNIVKHARASDVTIEMNTGDMLTVSIEDNGAGFNKNDIRPFSNGLINMEKRIMEIGGHLLILNEKGTTVKFTVPLAA